MKKIAKFAALVLAGTLLLVMTGCSGAYKGKVKQEIMDQINACRAQYDCAPITEVAELSAYEDALIYNFHKKQSTAIADDAINWERQKELHDQIPDEWKDDEGATDTHYFGMMYRETTGEWVLLCEYSTPEMLQAQLRTMWELTVEDYTAVGIGVTTVRGRTYWTLRLYCPPLAD